MNHLPVQVPPSTADFIKVPVRLTSSEEPFLVTLKTDTLAGFKSALVTHGFFGEDEMLRICVEFVPAGTSTSVPLTKALLDRENERSVSVLAARQGISEDRPFVVSLTQPQAKRTLTPAGAVPPVTPMVSQLYSPIVGLDEDDLAPQRRKTNPVSPCDDEMEVEKVLLGAFVPSANSYGLDRMPVDLRMLKASLRNSTQLQSVVAQIYARIFQEAAAVPLRNVAFSRRRSDTLICNVVYARTQQGKTESLAKLVYICALGGGVLPVVLVRNAGGAFTFEGLQSRIDKLGKLMVKTFGKSLSEKERNVLRPEIKIAMDLKKQPLARVHDLSRPVIVFARQSVTNLKKLFPDSPGSVSVLDQLKKVKCQPDEAFPYALFSDEDDSSISTADRSRTKYEQSFYCEPQLEEYEEERSRSSPDSPTSPGQLSSDEDETEPLMDFVEVQRTVSSVRNLCSLLVTVSATFMATVISKQEALDQMLNVIELPPPATYVGIRASERAVHRDVQIFEMKEAPKGERELFKRPGWSDFKQRLLESHKLASVNYKDGMPYVQTKQHKRSDCTQQHVSALICTTGARRNLVQLQVAQDLMAEMQSGADPRSQILTTFVFNQDTVRINFGLGIASKLSFQAVVSAVAQVVFGYDSKKRTAMWESLAKRTFDVEQGNEVEATFETFESHVCCTLSNVARAKRLINNYYDVIYAVHVYFSLAPLVICVSFNMANRQMTFKDSNHRYVLTDFFYDGAATSHIENAIQMTGRICSNDEFVQIPRRLFITGPSLKLARTGLQSYDELCQIFANRMLKFHDVWTHVSGHHRALLSCLDLNYKFTKPDLNKHAQATAQRTLFADVTDGPVPVNGVSTQTQALVRFLEAYEDAMKPKEIYERMRAAGLVQEVSCQEDRRHVLEEISGTDKAGRVFVSMNVSKDGERRERPWDSIYGVLNHHKGELFQQTDHGLWLLMRRTPGFY
eukprot:TRINITY_DN9337_c0_g1_i1.p1 TRINITY_DN9337_c0_g1~~TRINITY_DN9337_c0_g1_i1.p1  ORF type:complete len:962 (+),score=211.91 TRINITY_DN9337_c0_g1_i1:391-3276(+)